MPRQQKIGAPGKCFWCGYTRKMTLEHIVPKSCGGGEEDHNKTLSCLQCNQERGKVTGFYCSIQDFKKYLENWDESNDKRVDRAARMHKQLCKTFPKIKELQNKWQKIEELRMGHSPTAKVDLAIPEIPKLILFKEDNEFFSPEIKEMT